VRPLLFPDRSRQRPPTHLRRGHRLLLVLGAGAALLSGCSTFTETTTVARVGDVRLETSQFDALIAAVAQAPPEAERVTVERATADNVLYAWILTEVLRADLARAGVEITEVERQEARAEYDAQYGQEWTLTTPVVLVDLLIDQLAVINAWGQLGPDQATAVDIGRVYPQGPRVSGIICTAHLLVGTEAEANQALNELAEGVEFAQLATERSTDVGSGANGGFLGCQGLAEFQQIFVPEFAQAALEGTIGSVLGPVETQFGYHLIWIPPLDAFDGQVAEQVAVAATGDQTRFRLAAAASDIKVDPRYGTFDPDTGVSPLN